MKIKKFAHHYRGTLLLLLGLGLIRTAVADWNPIPSGSMHPNLLEGDVVLVNRLAYDLQVPLTDQIILPISTPQRGDVVTFSSPIDGTRLIKRIIAVGGDTVYMKNNVLYVNGQAAHYQGLKEHLEALPQGETTIALTATESLAHHQRQIQALPLVVAKRNFNPLTVPVDHYFMLGDNRDNSADSRFIGTVPRELLIGKAHHILASVDMLGNWMPRWERFGQEIH